MKRIDLITSAKPSAYDDLKALIFAKAPISRREKHGVIQPIVFGDNKPSDHLITIEKYARG